MSLRQTVERRSRVAVANCVTELFSYLSKRFEEKPPGIKSSTLTAWLVPLALFAIWLIVRRICRRHGEH